MSAKLAAIRTALTGSVAIWWLARTVWLTFAVGHLPPLLKRVTDPDLLASGVPLLLAEIYFLLKLADVSWLRLPHDRKAWFAFAVIIVLLHAPVIADVAIHADNLPWHLAVWPLVITLAVLGRRARDQRIGSLVRFVLDLQRQGWRNARRWTCAHLLPPRSLDLLTLTCAPQAPPLARG